MKDYASIEYINKYIEERMRHCYDEGYEQGFEDGSMDAKSRSEDAYQQGMDDAWELCGKIERMLFNQPQFQEAFGNVDFYTVITNKSVSYAMEKVKAWEEKQKPNKTDKSESTGINVSDVVNFSDNGDTIKAVVLDVDEEAETAVIFDEKGSAKWIEYKALEKTGEQFVGVDRMFNFLQEDVG